MKADEGNVQARHALREALVIGIGDAGGNMTARLGADWAGGPRRCVVNTDVGALDFCPLEYKRAVGEQLTRGLSAGGDPAVGKLAAEDDLDRLRALVSGLDWVALVYGLGGGTGTGVGPVLARLAAEEGALVLAVVTLPFEFEGPQRMRQAREGLAALRRHANSVICMPNQRMVEMVADRESLSASFDASDRVVGQCLRSLWRMIRRNGIINVDYADVLSLMREGGGCCAMGYGQGAGEHRAERALEDLLESPLLENGRLLPTAAGALVGITGGPELALRDVQRIMEGLRNALPQEAPVVMGAFIEEDWGDRMGISVLLAEREACPEPVPSPQAAAERPPPEPDTGPAVQAVFSFDGEDRGRFRNVESTVVDGQNLDIPTFIRRQVRIHVQ